MTPARQEPAAADDPGPEVGARQPDRERLGRAHRERRPDEGQLEGRGARVVADEEIGDRKAPRIGRTGLGDPEMRPARPANILDGRQQPAIEHLEQDLGPGLAHRSLTGTKRTVAPGRKRAGSARLGSKRRVVVRPISCQPPGIASG